MGNASWLSESWLVLWPGLGVHFLLVAAAVACGVIVGIERQRREKPAGLRTLLLVCLGSAVFTMISFAFTSVTGDSGRVAAQIVTGIGFLGAGVILRSGRTISGTTTAASIWMTAAIGMTVGAGYPLAGLALSLLVNRLLVGVFLYETRWHPALRDSCVIIEFNPMGGLTRVRLERVLVDYGFPGTSVQWTESSTETGSLTLNIRLGPIHLHELLAELVEVPHVCRLTQTSCPVRRPLPS
jgi:putative Mg2+ transporter-C (MgtC) family protein